MKIIMILCMLITAAMSIDRIQQIRMQQNRILCADHRRDGSWFSFCLVLPVETCFQFFRGRAFSDANGYSKSVKRQRLCRSCAVGMEHYLNFKVQQICAHIVLGCEGGCRHHQVHSMGFSIGKSCSNRDQLCPEGSY